MATRRHQRITIWVIAITMLVGTLGGFLVMVLAPKNQAIEQERMTKLTEQWQKDNEARQKKVDAQAAELSGQYFASFHEHIGRISAFDKASAESGELAVEDIVIGDGEAVGDDSVYSIYYFGWNPEGTMFDSSFNGDKTALGSPLGRQADGTWVFPGGQTGSVIPGWVEGIKGMKMGGIRELTLPSKLAYKEQGSGDAIPPNTPLKFVVFVIASPEAIPEVAIPPELLKYYQTGGR